MRAWVKSVCPALLLALAMPAVAAWNAQLQNGGQVRVDPETNRATVTRDGVTTPLWDGVHRLEDGSVITVRSGQVVPNEAILRARKPPPPPTDKAQTWVGRVIDGESPCERLVREVCGARGQCDTGQACDAARQLLDMEHRERAGSERPDLTTYSSGQCIEAGRDRQFFQVCRP